MDEPQRDSLNHSPDASIPPAPPITPPKPGSAWHSIFIGVSGLRPGWGFAIYVLAFVVLVLLISRATAPLVNMGRHPLPSIWRFLIGEMDSLVAALLPALALAQYEKRPFGAYGLPLNQAFRGRFWVGALWGICAISLLLLTMRGVGVFSFGGLALHGARILKFALFWSVLFIVVGLFEEFIMRGYTLFTLAQGIGFWPAALLLSAAFGAIHLANPGEAWVGALGAALLGLFFCFTLRRTGSLWFAVGMHASWDWGESFLYSVPDSGTLAPGHLLSSSFHGPSWITGGSVGPEGSVLVFVLIAAMWVIFERLYPPRQSTPT
jgi:uncharacterized protein